MVRQKKILKFLRCIFAISLLSPLEKGRALYLNKHESSFTQECVVPSLVEIDPVVLEKKRYFNFVHVFSLFRYYLHVEKGGAPHLNKLESPTPKDALCQVELKLAQWF